MVRAIWSSHTQVIFMPPWTFSNLKVQRGTIIQFEGAPRVPGIPAVPIPCPVMPARPIGLLSIIIVAISVNSFPSRSAGNPW
jgi:hypothetical protein